MDVIRPRPVSCNFPPFRVPPQEGSTTSYDIVAALELGHRLLEIENIIGRDDTSILILHPHTEETYTSRWKPWPSTQDKQ